MNEVSSGALIFVIPMLVAIVVLTAFPEIALFLPRLLLSNQ
jgi:TRAP-type C4-dicarboxylate transport system permease large subunit